MLNKKGDPFSELKSNAAKQAEIVSEINSLSNSKNAEDKKIVDKQVNSLKKSLIDFNNNIPKILDNIGMKKMLPQKIQRKTQDEDILYYPVKDEESERKTKERQKQLSKIFSMHDIEKDTLKRLKKGKRKKQEEEIARVKGRKPSTYARMASKLFSDTAFYMIKKEMFKDLQKDLIKANLKVHEKSYISMIFFTTLISFFIGIFLFGFFMFFSLSFTFPIISLSIENMVLRFLKTFWILFAIPGATFLFMYFYPSLERDSIGNRINLELPFATINMSAISGSLIDPTKIFQIILLTKEYPYLEKEFIKLMNNINVLGYDLVTALRNSAFNTASKKLADLFNGLATTINSGGDLVKFFNERAESLLFEYNLEREKSTRAAETFMDVYISIVIAAPMILMLVLIIMRITGLGITLSTTAITLIMVFGVSLINAVFLMFLHLKQPNT